MLTSWTPLLAVIGVIVLLAAGVAVVIATFLRRSDRHLQDPDEPHTPDDGPSGS